MFHYNEKTVQFEWFTGIDVSKATLEVAFCQKDNPEQQSYRQFDNTTAGFKRLLSWLKNQGVNSDANLFCMEHTARLPLGITL